MIEVIKKLKKKSIAFRGRLGGWVVSADVAKAASNKSLRPQK